MAGAGEGDESGLRIGRYVTDSVEAAPMPDPSAVPPTVSTSTNAPTQLLPVVKTEPTIVDVPTIRARARRPATPLPALGSDAAAPTRGESKRRRQASAAPAPSAPPSASSSASPPPFVPPSPPPVASVPPPPPPVVTPVLAVDEGSPDASALEADTGELPIVGQQPVIVDADAVEDPPARHRVPEAGETAVLDAIVVADVVTDVVAEPLGQEAAVVRPAAGPADGWDPIADADDSRPGPAAIEADDWDAEPETTGDVDTYHGRRRADMASKRLWLVVAAVVVALAAAVGLPLALTSSSATEDPTTAAAPPPFVGATDPGAPPTGELISAASSVGPSVSRPPTSKPPTSTAPPTVNPTTVPPVGFSPITLQAEAASLSGDVRVDSNPTCSPGGPPVVAQVGKWTSGSAGVVTFSTTLTTAGQYVVTVHYVITGDSSRQAVVSVINGSGTANQTVTFLNSERSGSPPTCVDPQPGITVTLAAGNNQIRISNSSNRAPTLDKIVITKA